MVYLFEEMEPNIQKQHIIPQVYLKQFGFRKDEKWFVSVLKIGAEMTANVEIVDFLKEINVFDLSFGPQYLRRHFDSHSRILENHYRTIISNLDHQKRITEKDWDYLNHIVANFLCRSAKFRSAISGFLGDSSTREVLLREINTFFDETSDEYLKLPRMISSGDQLHITIGTLMDHLVKVFRSFKKVILKAPDNTSWITSDNPVYIDRQEDWTWIVPIEAEIFLPLSRNYCLIMIHEESQNPRFPNKHSLKVNKVNAMTFDTVDEINSKIVMDSKEFIIFGTQFKETKASSFWSDE